MILILILIILSVATIFFLLGWCAACRVERMRMFGVHHGYLPPDTIKRAR